MTTAVQRAVPVRCQNALCHSAVRSGGRRRRWLVEVTADEGAELTVKAKCPSCHEEQRIAVTVPVAGGRGVPY